MKCPLCGLDNNCVDLLTHWSCSSIERPLADELLNDRPPLLLWKAPPLRKRGAAKIEVMPHERHLLYQHAAECVKLNVFTDLCLQTVQRKIRNSARGLDVYLYYAHFNSLEEAQAIQDARPHPSLAWLIDRARVTSERKPSRELIGPWLKLMRFFGRDVAALLRERYFDDLEFDWALTFVTRYIRVWHRLTYCPLRCNCGADQPAPSDEEQRAMMENIGSRDVIEYEQWLSRNVV